MRFRKELSPRLAVVVLAVVFTLVGAAVTAWGVVDYRRAQASRNWPTANGRVQYATVETRSSRNDSGTSSTTFQARIIYGYEIGGQTLRSERVSFGEVSTSDPADAEEIVARYQPGTTVTVYYDPQNPELAVLEPGVSLGNYLLLGIGSVFFVAGLMLSAVAVLVRWPQVGTSTRDESLFAPE